MQQALFNTALKLLSNRDTTTAELARLLEKEYPNLKDIDNEIEKTLNRLEKLHLLNDNNLANNLARKYQHKGNRFIKQNLKQKGLSEDLIESAIAELPFEQERALIEAQKKWRTIKGDDARAKENKLLRFLSGRGFSADACYYCIDALKNEDGL